jgi:predicted secreted protein
MGWVSGIVVYVVVWWIVLFAVLPWGVATPDHADPGLADSAPVKPRLLTKFAVTSVVALIVWVGIDLVIASGLVSFREMARGLP